ncbi:MAG: ISAs1 family transposase [Desulfobulbaceae bacterium]|nr:ISAs1 family transposase [Desulfobulbaceae bacterium]
MKAKDASIITHFSNITDPRIKNKIDHKLIDIMVIAICAVICGADAWKDIELFGKAKHEWLSKFLELPNGIPSHDTFGRVFSLIAPKEFQGNFINWVQSAAEVSGGRIIPIDGKTLRRSYDSASNKAAIHMVSAWASKSQIVLGQVKTNEKSNEITAIPELLNLLDINGCIVTIDAMGCQKKIADQIIQQGGDYVLGLKDNQKNMLDASEDFFNKVSDQQVDSGDVDFYMTEDKGHGRHEIRSHFIAEIPPEFPNKKAWHGLKTIGIVVSDNHKKNHVSTECRYYLCSIDKDAKQFSEAVRSHWGIENSVHWVLDVSFREDESRVRKDNAPENLAVLRHIALNLLKHSPRKASIKAKRKIAGWDNEFLAKVVWG